ncbi:MAG: NADP-dependent malic enzyme [Rhodospirillales bacterium]|nr:NADP-dependent malic enzyme [Rhodospirillales bacterium]
MARETLEQSALNYHKFPTPGKISVKVTTPMATQRDLALAYSPGVAAPCLEIEKDPSKALDYTSRGNMVAVISNGTAVLGLGDIGALASKPVMEGKAALFKKFADVDCFDLEVDEKDPDAFIEAVARLEPSFGGINLEDIKAPECFYIEEKLRERMNIPVFHDDQHGTAIIVTAALKNWIFWSGRDIKKIRLVANGAGAASIACLNLIVEAGLPRENIIVCDRKGVVYDGRNEGMDPYKQKFAIKTDLRELKDALKGADIFLGLSGPNMLDESMVASMADAPLIMALANPTPEVLPEVAKAAKADCVVCTGRSDYPNQVNNVLCFPFIFRGALDVGATKINEEMKLACVDAIADLARKEAPAEVASVYVNENLEFGPEYLIPKPFDPRLIINLPIAVAKAAMESGVATRPIQDFEAYKQKLTQYFYKTNQVMQPIFERARQNPKKIVYAEGEEERVLRAVQIVVDENLAFPILIGRKKVVETRIKKLRLRLVTGQDFDLVDPEDDPRYRDYWETYHQLMQRRGVPPAVARTVVRSNATVIAALMVHKNQADGLVCGTVGQYKYHLKNILNVISLKEGVETPAALGILSTEKGTFFITDTQVTADPTSNQICNTTLLAAEEMKRFGITPKVAILSHSNFGVHKGSAEKMRQVVAQLREMAPDLEMDGEMHADCALNEEIRREIMPHTTLTGIANLLVMPNIEAANISFNMLKIMAEGISIGPILLGLSRPAHILTYAATARSIVNITALACVGAQVYDNDTVGAAPSATQDLAPLHGEKASAHS